MLQVEFGWSTPDESHFTNEIDLNVPVDMTVRNAVDMPGTDLLGPWQVGAVFLAILVTVKGALGKVHHKTAADDESI